MTSTSRTSVSTAQDYLLETLELRRDGLAAVADAIPRRARRPGTAPEHQPGVADDAGLLGQRRALQPALRAQRGARGQRGGGGHRGPGARARSCRTPEWLDPAFVADQVAGVRSGEDQGDDAAAPGLHGNGLGTVTLGGIALTPGGLGHGPAGRRSRLRGPGGQPGREHRDRRAGARDGGRHRGRRAGRRDRRRRDADRVDIAARAAADRARTVSVEVEVEAVPGEEQTDNNTGTFSVIFTQ